MILSKEQVEKLVLDTEDIQVMVMISDLGFVDVIPVSRLVEFLKEYEWEDGEVMAYREIIPFRLNEQQINEIMNGEKICLNIEDIPIKFLKEYGKKRGGK